MPILTAGSVAWWSGDRMRPVVKHCKVLRLQDKRFGVSIRDAKPDRPVYRTPAQAKELGIEIDLNYRFAQAQSAEPKAATQSGRILRQGIATDARARP